MAEVVWGVDDPTILRYFIRGGADTSEDLTAGTLVERPEEPAQFQLSAAELNDTLIPTTHPLGKVGVYWYHEE